MDKQSNTGWYVIGGIALLACVLTQLSKTNDAGTAATANDQTIPDTAKSTDIILATNKP